MRKDKEHMVKKAKSKDKCGKRQREETKTKCITVLVYYILITHLILYQTYILVDVFFYHIQP